MSTGASGPLRPFVSILVPVRNEERSIERCLYSIAAQSYPRDRIEVLVIDGMSQDRTRAIISRFAAETSIDLRLFDNPRLIPAAALNIGLQHARGDLILRVDGHAALGAGYLQRCVQALDQHAAECAGGVLLNEGYGTVGRAIAAAMSSPFGVGGARFRTGGAAGETDTVAFGVYRSDVFDHLGGFDESLVGGEDDEFNYRLRDAGGLIVLVPDAIAAYTVRGDLRSLARQYFRYGFAKPRVLARHPRQARARQLIPPASAIAGIAAGVAAIAGRPAALRALLGAYALLTTGASVAMGRRHGWRAVPAMPPVFFCMHAAYGLGFLAGTALLFTNVSALHQPSRANEQTPFG